MVAPLSRRRPWKLAKEVTTLDHLSGGLQRYVGDLAGRAGFELVSGRHPDHSVEAYADVGVTWLVDSTWPDPGWLADFRARVLGPVEG